MAIDPCSAYQELARNYSLFVGSKYKNITESNKRVLYAAELLKDGASIEVVMETMIKKASSDSLPASWVDEQLRNTFGYIDEQTIPPLM